MSSQRPHPYSQEMQGPRCGGTIKMTGSSSIIRLCDMRGRYGV